MKSAYPRNINLCALWALHGALSGVPYNRLDHDERDALRLQLEAAEGQEG
jgi:hypothetical protein